MITSTGKWPPECPRTKPNGRGPWRTKVIPLSTKAPENREEPRGPRGYKPHRSGPEEHLGWGREDRPGSALTLTVLRVDQTFSSISGGATIPPSSIYHLLYIGPRDSMISTTGERPTKIER